MNTIQPKDWVEEYNVYNQTFETKEVTLFADKYEPHTGVVKKQTTKEGELIEAGGKYISRFTFYQTELQKTLFSYFELNGKRIMFSTIFSPLQFQSNQLQLIPNCCYFKRENLDFKVQLESVSNNYVSMITTNNVAKDAEEKINLTGKQFCIIISNNSTTEKRINVLETLSGKTDVKGISVYSPINDLPETGEDVAFDTLDIVSFNKEVFLEPFALKSIRTNDKILFFPNGKSWISFYQFQNCIARIEDKYMLGNDKEMEVTILPHTKVMYHFYQKEIASDQKSSQ